HPPPLHPFPTRRSSDLERGGEAVERVRELTDGLGPHSVLECVGLEQAVATALEIARRGGAVGRVGVPQNDTLAAGVAFWKNVSRSEEHTSELQSRFDLV